MSSPSESGAEPVVPVQQRRKTFVDDLYLLQWNVESGDGHWRGEARGTLARLRRSLVGPRQEAEAYQFVFQHDPPQRELPAWLLVAGLFALHPQLRRGAQGPRSIGASMAELRQKRGEAVVRRFTQLLSVDRDSLPHYLRQSVQLLRSGGVSLHYGQLLTDLVVLLGEEHGSDRAHKTRLEWARDFHRQPTTASRTHATSRTTV